MQMPEWKLNRNVNAVLQGLAVDALLEYVEFVLHMSPVFLNHAYDATWLVSAVHSRRYLGDPPQAG